MRRELLKLTHLGCKVDASQVYAGKDKVIGISKIWGGALKEFFTTADIWGITCKHQYGAKLQS